MSNDDPRRGPDRPDRIAQDERTLKRIYGQDPDIIDFPRKVDVVIDCRLIDAAHLVYECSDVSAGIFDGGVPLVYQGDADDLIGGRTLPGHYRTDRSRGLIQLGSPPVFNVRNAPPTPGTPRHELAGAALARWPGGIGEEPLFGESV